MEGVWPNRNVFFSAERAVRPMNGTGMDPQKWSFFTLLGSRWEMKTPMKLWKFYGFECSIYRFFNGFPLQGKIKSRISHGVVPSISPIFGETDEVGSPWRAAAAGGCPGTNAQHFIAIAADAMGAAAVRHVRAEETMAVMGGQGCRGEFTAGVFGWI